MKLPAIPIPKIKVPDFTHLHRGSLIAAGIAIAAAVLFIVIPDAQTAAHGLRSGHDVEVLVTGIRTLYGHEASFSRISNADLAKIESRVQSADANSVQDGWLLNLKVRPDTLQQPDDAFALSFVEADGYACPRVVKAMAGEATRITVGGTEVSSATTALSTEQVQSLCSGPNAVIEMTFART
jgi:hypothetical protein